MAQQVIRPAIYKKIGYSAGCIHSRGLSELTAGLRAGLRAASMRLRPSSEEVALTVEAELTV